MRKIGLIGCCCGVLVWLAGCGGSPHATTEKFYLIATNIKIPYWQGANAGCFAPPRN